MTSLNAAPLCMVYVSHPSRFANGLSPSSPWVLYPSNWVSFRLEECFALGMPPPKISTKPPASQFGVAVVIKSRVWKACTRWRKSGQSTWRSLLR
eukprot:2338746-Pleurochrysis_carterae.AAC.1